MFFGIIFVINILVKLILLNKKSTNSRIRDVTVSSVSKTVWFSKYFQYYTKRVYSCMSTTQTLKRF